MIMPPKRTLTLNACTVCRKKRTKPCTRCRLRHEHCFYEDREWHTKEFLRSEMRRLECENLVLRALLSSCRDEVLQRIRAGEPINAIAESYQDDGGGSGSTGSSGIEPSGIGSSGTNSSGTGFNLHPRYQQNQQGATFENDKHGKRPLVETTTPGNPFSYPRHGQLPPLRNPLIPSLTPPGDDETSAHLGRSSSLASSSSASHPPPPPSPSHESSPGLAAAAPNFVWTPAGVNPTPLRDQPPTVDRVSPSFDFNAPLSQSPSLTTPSLSQDPDNSAASSSKGAASNDAHTAATAKVASGSAGKGKSPKSPQVALNDSLIQYLLKLFFKWEASPFSMVCENLFWMDYRPQVEDMVETRTYCSPALVNAIIALASRFLVDDEILSSQLIRRLPSSPSVWGDQFSRESRDLLSSTRRRKTLCDIQALGILALREMSRGRDIEAEILVQEAIEALTTMRPVKTRSVQEVKEYATAQATTLSGLLLLTRMTRLVTTQICDNREPETTAWELYHRQPLVPDQGLNSKLLPAINMLEGIVREHPELHLYGNHILQLSELVCSMPLRLQQSPGYIKDASAAYKECLTWYDSISAFLRRLEMPTPKVLFTHIYYHFSLVILFRPLIKFSPTEEQGASSFISPRTICAESVHSIISLTENYDHLFGFRQAPSLFPHIVLAAGLMQVTLDTTSKAKANNTGDFCVPTPTSDASPVSPESFSLFSSPLSFGDQGSIYSMSQSPVSSLGPHSFNGTTSFPGLGYGAEMEVDDDPDPTGEIALAISHLAAMRPVHPAAAQARSILRGMCPGAAAVTDARSCMKT